MFPMFSHEFHAYRWNQYFASCNAMNINCTPDFIATHLYTCSPTILTS